MTTKTIKYTWICILFIAFASLITLGPLYTIKHSIQKNFNDYNEITKEITVTIIESDRIEIDDGFEHRLKVRLINPFNDRHMNKYIVTKCKTDSDYCQTASDGYYQKGKRIAVTFVNTKPVSNIYLKFRGKNQEWFQTQFITSIITSI